jgi:RNA polymerase sigma-70 factor (ECF subfamily)
MTDWPNIVGECGPAVWKTLRRLLGHVADADDCFQNVFLSALELSRTQTVRHWPALLHQLAIRRALERLRQRYRESHRVQPLGDLSPVDRKIVQPDGAAQAGELAEWLRQALSQLDVRQAEVFCLACLEDLSYAEIAERLELSVNHVGVLLNRARAALRKMAQDNSLSPLGARVG